MVMNGSSGCGIVGCCSISGGQRGSDDRTNTHRRSGFHVRVTCSSSSGSISTSSSIRASSGLSWSNRLSITRSEDGLDGSDNTVAARLLLQRSRSAGQRWCRTIGCTGSSIHLLLLLLLLLQLRIHLRWLTTSAHATHSSPIQHHAAPACKSSTRTSSTCSSSGAVAARIFGSHNRISDLLRHKTHRLRSGL